MTNEKAYQHLADMRENGHLMHYLHSTLDELAAGKSTVSAEAAEMRAVVNSDVKYERESDEKKGNGSDLKGRNAWFGQVALAVESLEYRAQLDRL